MKNRRKSVYFLKQETDDEKEPTPKRLKTSEPKASRYRIYFDDDPLIRNDVQHEYLPSFNYNQNQTSSVKFLSNEPSCKISTAFPLVLAKEAPTGFDICLERPKKYEESKLRLNITRSKYNTSMSKFS